MVQGTGTFDISGSAADSEKPSDANGAGVSNWRLPQWFYPDGSKPPLTYHPDRRRWRRDSEHAYLRSVGRGQEFVLDLVHTVLLNDQRRQWESDSRTVFVEGAFLIVVFQPAVPTKFKSIGVPQTQVPPSKVIPQKKFDTVAKTTASKKAKQSRARRQREDEWWF